MNDLSRQFQRQLFSITLVLSALFSVTVGARAEAPYVDLILPASATSSSVNNAQQPAFNSCDNHGMSGPRGPLDIHDTSASDMWLSANPDTNCSITYDLGAVYPIGYLDFWNYAEVNNLGSCAGRGVKTMTVSYSTNGSTWTNLNSGSTFTMAKANTSSLPTPPTNQTNGQPISFGGAAARYIKFQILTSYGGEFGNEPQLYGISQVRFYRWAPGVISTASDGDSYIGSKVDNYSTESESPDNTDNNLGMNDNYTKTATHDAAAADMWESANNDTNCFLTYDLGGTYDNITMAVWNYNAGAAKVQGVKSALIYWSMDDYNWNLLSSTPSTFTEALGVAGQKLSGTVSIPHMARYIKIAPQTNFLTSGNTKLFGLSAVRFYAGAGTVVEEVPDFNALVDQHSVTAVDAWSGSDANYSLPYTVPSSGKQNSLFLWDDTLDDQGWNPVTWQRNNWYLHWRNTTGIYTGDQAGVTYTPAPSSVTFDTNDTIVPTNGDDAYWYTGGVSVASQQTAYLFMIGVIGLGVNDVNMFTLPYNSSGAMQWSSRSAFISIPYVYETNTFLGLKTALDGWVFDDTANSGYYYIYGLAPNGLADVPGTNVLGGVNNGVNQPEIYVTSNVIVARSTLANLATPSNWQLYESGSWVTGNGVASAVASATPISSTSDISSEFSVTHTTSGQYMLTYQKYVYGPLVDVAYSSTPYGPFTGETDIFHLTQQDYNWAAVNDNVPNFDHWYGQIGQYNADETAYNAKAHPELSKPNESVISVNLNTTPTNAILMNADAYHGVFLRMRTIN